MRKTIKMLIIVFCMTICLIACADKCEHAYDGDCDTACNECSEAREVTTAHSYYGDCDTTCNVCSETREASAEHNYYGDCDDKCHGCGLEREITVEHSWKPIADNTTCTEREACEGCGAIRGDYISHSWKDATCITPKTCELCGDTDGEALGHTPAEDDSDCGTDVLCTVCGAITTPARLEHMPCADDGDCTTSITCIECGWLMKPAHEHNFQGVWKTDADGHWRVCQNIDCTVVGTKEEHDKGENGQCTICEYVVEVTPSHEHSYTIEDYNDTYHYMKCACGQIDESTKVSHTAISDNNCITPDLCSCGYTVTVAKNHIAGEDDGNCTTPIGCVNCEQDAKAGATGHHDADHDYTCDNAGCQVTVGIPPKDNN